LKLSFLSHGRDSNPRPWPYQDLNDLKKELDLRKLYLKLRSDFIEYLIKIRNINKILAKSYDSAIYRFLLNGITNPKELEKIVMENRKDKLIKGLRNFFNYLEYQEIYELNGYSLDQWKKRLKLPRSNVREIYISDEEIIEAYNRIKDNEQLELCFKLLVFSGLRLKHLWEAMKEFDRSKIIVKDKIARYPVSFVSKSTKKSYWLYMPSSIVNELKKFRFNYWYYQKGIKFNRVDSSTIRKWHLNKLIELNVPESIADFIQGRASITVGSTHYLNKTKQADKWYSRVVDKITKIFILNN